MLGIGVFQFGYFFERMDKYNFINFFRVIASQSMYVG